MPSSPNYKRDYGQEYSSYHGKSEQKKKRAKRNAARAKMVKSGAVSKGDGKDVDHKKGVAAGNGKANLRVQSKSTNRSIARNKNAQRKGTGYYSTGR